MNIQQEPYIRNQRNFPDKDLSSLSLENDKAYIDIAGKINTRTIGTFALNAQIVTGEQWYLEGNAQKQQTLRQVYLFSDSQLTVPHGINISQLDGFTKIYGTFTDGNIWYPLPYVDVSNANNQINVMVDSSDIIIKEGAGSPPSLTNGYIVLEWLAMV
jgi:hypothetical protein